MMRRVDLGSIYLPVELIEMVEKHKEFMLDANKDSDSYDVLTRASFSMYFGDFMAKNYYKLNEENDEVNDL